MTNVIEFTGTYTRIKPQITRPVMCPDGMLRFITLHEDFWDTLAYVQKRHGIGHWDAFVAYCWELADHYDGDLRERLQHAFAYYIYSLSRIAHHVENGLGNDNWEKPNGRVRYFVPPEALR